MRHVPNTLALRGSSKRNVSLQRFCERTILVSGQRYVYCSYVSISVPHASADGSDLLRLSNDYNVHISLRQNPLGLRVEGARASVRELTEHLLVIRKVCNVAIVCTDHGAHAHADVRRGKVHPTIARAHSTRHDSTNLSVGAGVPGKRCF